MNKFILLGALVLLFSGCMKSNDGTAPMNIFSGGAAINIKELPKSEVVEKITEANNWSKYSLIMSSNQQMKFDMNEEDGGSGMTVQMIFQGTVDRAGKEILLKGSAGTKYVEQGEDSPNRIEVRNGEMKITMNGKTQTMRLNEDLWKQYSPIDYSLTSMAFLGFEYLADERDQYVLISNLTNTGIKRADDSIRESGVNENYIKMWVNKKDLRITKTLFHVNMVSDDFSQVMDIESKITPVA